MGSERMNELKPKSYEFAKIKGGKEWEKYKESVKKQSSIVNRDKKNQLYKDNYLLGLDGYGGYADDIKEMIEKLPADLVVQTHYQEQEASIKFYYEGLEGLQEKDTVIETIRAIWTKVSEDYEKEINSGL